MSRKQDTAEFQSRLGQLSERWSQSEIARKTGTLRNNVSRYMHGGKMPVEFAASLVRNLGVNPAWLLVGEGAPLLSDVNAQTGRMAGELLELVEAMNAVANLQLGSLTGKHHLRMLRELNDALGRYETLRAGINQRTGPIFSQLLDDYWAALEAWNLDKADDLRKAAEQVARLCDDDALQERFERTLSFHAFLRRDEDESILHQSRLFQRRLSGAGIDEAGMKEAFNLSNTLQSNARLDDALALCDAAMALAGQRGRQWPVTRLMRAMSGYIWMERGDVREGLRRVVDAHPQTSAAYRAVQHSMLIRGLLLAGDIDYRGAVDMRGEGPAHAQGMLSYAMWLEDPDVFELACRHYLALDQSPATQFARLLREVLVEGRKANALKFLKTYPAKARMPLNEQFDQEVFATGLARLCGAKDTRRRHARAWKLIEQSGERCYSIVARTMHYRNVIALERSRRAEAGDFFTEHLERGYGCFRGIVEALA
ncbi:MAG: helix-turn-helix transcriptional regulator [Planctomycetes bacterium]|nr:helix-turn-helix transcriptional regulator [Planctomycetota bacterium]